MGGDQRVGPASLATKAIENLGLPLEVTEALKEIQVQASEAYKDAFLTMVGALNKQASALDRIQATLSILVKHFEPQLGNASSTVPPVLKVAASDDEADLATTLVVPDPIAAGYTLSQSALAKALGLPQTDVSILVKPFGLAAESRCAVTVRPGAGRPMVNYHLRAVERFKALVSEPPKNLTTTQQRALKRVRRRILPVR